MEKIFESDLTENLFELVANTEFKSDAENFFQSLRNSDTDFELNKDNCTIEIADNENKCVYLIRVQKTHQF